MSGPVVYFIGSVGGPIKIGFANDLAKRLGELQMGNHEQLHVFATLPGWRKEEQQLHRRYAAYRLRGEWFAPAPELLDYIWKVAGRNRRSEKTQVVLTPLMSSPIEPAQASVRVRDCRLIRLAEVQRITGMSRSAIYATLDFPESVKIGPRAVAWISEEVHEWLSVRIAERDAT